MLSLEKKCSKFCAGSRRNPAQNLKPITCFCLLSWPTLNPKLVSIQLRVIQGCYLWKKNG